MNSKLAKILVGIDFSPDSERALEWAAHLAESLGAHLQLVHVHSEPVVLVPEQLIVPPAAEPADLAVALRALSDRVLGGRIAVTLHVRTGRPGPSLLDAIAELHPDLVVVGSHGHGAVMRLLLGSTSTEVSHHSPVPVLIVPAEARVHKALKRQPLAPLEWRCARCGRVRLPEESAARCAGCGSDPAEWNSSPL